MGDLCESSESEDISSFFQNFLQNSSTLANSTTLTAAGGGFLRLLGGGEASAPVAEFSSSLNFSDPRNLFPKGGKGFHGITQSVSRGEFANENNIENLSFSCEEGSEAARVCAPRRSSKRSRAAEVHNMSEKRRRSLINEKLKALQNLIPNSNKTDKASMLDEAIEYLKQLQLQVQMLTMRNRLSLHPGYTLGSLQSALPSSEFDVDEGNLLLNTNRGADTSFRDQEIFMQNAVGSSSHASSMQPIPSSFTPSMHNHNGIVNPLASSEVTSHWICHGMLICPDCNQIQATLDMIRPPSGH